MDSPLQSILGALAIITVPGMTTLDLDRHAAMMISASRCEPAFLGYQPRGAAVPYPYTLCVSIDNEVIHGLPSERKIEDGMVVSLDLGLKKRKFGVLDKEQDRLGYNPWEYDDGALTVIVGNGSSAARRLVEGTKSALEAAVVACKPGKTTLDVGRAVAQVAKFFQLGIIQQYGGHGIGEELHMAPHIPNEPLGEPVKFHAGHRYALEPMFCTKRGEVYTDSSNWTVKLKGGGIAAHFERTVEL